MEKLARDTAVSQDLFTERGNCVLPCHMTRAGNGPPAAGSRIERVVCFPEGTGVMLKVRA
jgi:hypothetical protein